MATKKIKEKWTCQFAYAATSRLKNKNTTLRIDVDTYLTFTSCKRATHTSHCRHSRRIRHAIIHVIQWRLRLKKKRLVVTWPRGNTSASLDYQKNNRKNNPDSQRQPGSGFIGLIHSIGYRFISGHCCPSVLRRVVLFFLFFFTSSPPSTLFRWTAPGHCSTLKMTVVLTVLFW